MNTTLDGRILSNLTVSALERIAFVLADAIEPEFLADYPEPQFAARVRYAGPDQGSVILLASSGFLLEFASSLLGVERNEVSLEREGMDGLCELTNIVGGSVVRAIGGCESLYRLGLPEIINLAKANAGASQASCHVESEQERLSVLWQPHVGAQSEVA